MKKVLISLIAAAFAGVAVFVFRGELSSVLADITLKTQKLRIMFSENVSLAEKNRELAGAYEREVLKNKSNVQLMQENDRLKSMLSIRENVDIPVVAATVISFGNGGDYEYLFADRGTDDGVYPGSCVISEGGFLGVVYECGKNWCGIKTLKSGDLEISVTCSGNGKTYLLSGGDGKLSFVSRNDDVSVGDLLVSSGLSGNIPKGLKIGRVFKVGQSSNAEKMITVTPVSDYEDLLYVLIASRGGNKSE